MCGYVGVGGVCGCVWEWEGGVEGEKEEKLKFQLNVYYTKTKFVEYCIKAISSMYFTRIGIFTISKFRAHDKFMPYGQEG